MNKSTYEYEYSMRLEGERDTPIYCTEYILVLGLLVWTAMDQIRAYAVEIEMSPSTVSEHRLFTLFTRSNKAYIVDCLKSISYPGVELSELLSS